MIHPRAPFVRVEGEKIDGTSITVRRGQQLIVSLPKQPTNGYKWVVTQVPKELGSPKESEEAGDSKAGGSKGSTLLTWETNSPMLQSGEKYSVTLGLKRPWEKTSAQTIKFDVTFE